MKKKIFSILFTLVLVLSFSLVTAVPVAAQTDRLVPSEYATIQAAIDDADPGDTIIVADGIYQESISVTTAGLTLRSENGRDSTIIENVGNVVSPEAAQCGFLIRGSANNFTLGGAADQGFTFSGGTSPRLIQLNNAPSGVEVSYNTVNTTGDASTGINIGAAGATGLTVSNNIFVADEDATYQDWPLIASNLSGSVLDVTVTDNEFTGSGTPDKYGAAIDLENVGVSSGTSTFSGNTISAFDRGIIIDGTTYNLDVSGNTISNCGKGVLFRPDTHAEMENNTFANNTYNIYHAAEILTGGSSFYGNIQDAIDNAIAGDTINVVAGEYVEAVEIDKALTLQGETGAIIKPDTAGNAIEFTVDHVTIDGFEVDGGDVVLKGILGYNSNDSVISNNVVHNIENPTADDTQGVGILFFSWDQPVTGCLIEGNTVYTTSRLGIWIGGWDSSTNKWLLSESNVIKNNTVHHAYLGPTNETMPQCGGICMDGAKNCTIEGNTTYSNATEIPMPGIYIKGSAEGNVIQYNDTYGNDIGIAVNTNASDVNYDGAMPVAPEVHYNNIHGNTSYGLKVIDATLVDAENNWWGDASGPSHSPGSGDKVSDYVDYDPWLLEPVVPGEPLPTAFDKTQVLNVGWTLVSTDNWIDCETLITPATTSWQGVTLAYKYTAGIGYEDAFVADLVPVNALYLKTVGGGGIGIVYSGGVPVASSKKLEAGWNLISSATETDAKAVLSPLRYIDVGEEQGVGLATLVSQDRYNRNSKSFYLATLGLGDWFVLGHTPLNPFDGYWVYMNAGKVFGVVPD